MYQTGKKCHEPLDGNFKLEAVIVCVHYADFLRCTLPHNKQLFDRLVVVTTPEDKETQRICEFYHVECVKSERLQPQKGKFCKGAGINDGLKKLSRDAWVIHLDADIWLPPLTRILLQRAKLNPEMVYGLDRFNIRGWDQWQDFLKWLPLQQEAGAYIHMDKSRLQVGTRFMQEHMGGYLPIGFFQMWCPRISGVHEYPEHNTTAGHTDLLFSNNWPRSRRGFIPEIVAYHLESEDSGYGTNWSGRKTAPFEPKIEVAWYRKLWNTVKKHIMGG